MKKILAALIVAAGAYFFYGKTAASPPAASSRAAATSPNNFFAPLVQSSAVCLAGQTNFYGTCVNTLRVLGSPGPSEFAYGTLDGNSAYNLGGLAVDRSVTPNRIYVTDTKNARVLGWSTLGAVLDPDRPADIAIGQPDFMHGACNHDVNTGITGPASPDSLCLIPFPLPSNLAEFELSVTPTVDSLGNLYVPDFGNHRILKYNQPFNPSTPGGGDAIADGVWGQSDLYSNGINQGRGPRQPTADSLWLGPSGFGVASGFQMSVDAGGNAWVPDTLNDRVLRFPAGGGAATIVLGTASFTDTGNTLWRPYIAKINTSSGELYVVDVSYPSFESRISVFAPPFSNGMPATRIITPSGVPPNHQGWKFMVSGLEFNRYKQGAFATGEFWVTEWFGNARADLLDINGAFVNFIGGPTADAPVAWEMYTWPRICNVKQNPVPDHTQPMRYLIGALDFDSDNNVYLPISRPSVVQRYAMPYSVSGDGCPPPGDGLMGGHDLSVFRGWNTSGPARFEGGYFAPIAYGNQAVVVDLGRMMVWNDYLNKQDGADSDFVLGAGFRLSAPAIAVQRSKSRLWIFADNKLGYLTLPLVPGEVPVEANLLWQDDGTPVSTGARYLSFNPVDDSLWITDQSNNRLLRVLNTDPVSGNLYVDMVQGQTSKTGTQCNQGLTAPTARTLCSPIEAEFDRLGNLFVVENDYESHGNGRVIAYLQSDIASGAPGFPDLAAKVILNIAGITNFTTGYHGDGTVMAGLDRPDSPISIAFNSRNELIVTRDGYYPGDNTYPEYFVNPSPLLRSLKQLYHYTNPLTQQIPDHYIRLPLGAGRVNFDENDNLVIQDHTWPRLWIINYDRDPSWLWPLPANRFTVFAVTDYGALTATTPLQIDLRVSFLDSQVPITFSALGVPSGVAASFSGSTLTLTETGGPIAVTGAAIEVKAGSAEGNEQSVIVYVRIDSAPTTVTPTATLTSVPPTFTPAISPTPTPTRRVPPGIRKKTPTPTP